MAALSGNIAATFKGGHLPAVLNWNPFLKAKPGEASYSRLGILQLYDAVIKGHPYPVKAVWFSFINFLNQCADSVKIEKEIVFNDRARTTLKARITESVRPGVINIMQGWWIDQFSEGSVNHLTHAVINPVQEKVYEPNMHMNDVAVEVMKAEKKEVE